MPIYNEFRPQTFHEVIGQESSVAILRNAVKYDKLSNAYLLYGLRGSCKTTIARILAKAVNCENPTAGDPCNNCPSCRAIASGCPDVVELDGASNNSVEDIREIVLSSKTIPMVLKYKVFILDEAHMFSNAASNALLKTLEEPPERTIFILCTTERTKILPTIASRCQRLEFRSLTLNEIEERIQYVTDVKQYTLEADAMRLIALGAGGSLRDALSDLDKIMSAGAHSVSDVQRINGIVPEDCFFEALSCYASGDICGVLNAFNGLSVEQINQSVAKSMFLQIISDRLVYLTSEKVLAGVDKTERYKEQVRGLDLSYAACLSLLETFNSPVVELRYAFVSAIAREQVLLEPLHKVEAYIRSAPGTTPVSVPAEPAMDACAPAEPDIGEETGEEFKAVSYEDECPFEDESGKTSMEDTPLEEGVDEDECPFEDEPEDEGDDGTATPYFNASAFEGLNLGFML